MGTATKLIADDRRSISDLFNVTFYLENGYLRARDGYGNNVLPLHLQTLANWMLLPKNKCTQQEITLLTRCWNYSGCVYLVSTTVGYFKIGCTKNLLKRMAELHRQYAFDIELIHVIEAAYHFGAEQKLHYRFRNKRLDGSEFFALTDEDIRWIKSIERM
jgi:Meiotically Up-regulated Gene 113 (MUG113) protein